MSNVATFPVPLDAQIRAIRLAQDIIAGRAAMPQRQTERMELAKRLEAPINTLTAIEPVAEDVRAAIRIANERARS